jgi:hypothetical protein
MGLKGRVYSQAAALVVERAVGHDHQQLVVVQDLVDRARQQPLVDLAASLRTMGVGGGVRHSKRACGVSEQHWKMNETETR